MKQRIPSLDQFILLESNIYPYNIKDKKNPASELEAIELKYFDIPIKTVDKFYIPYIKFLKQNLSEEIFEIIADLTFSSGYPTAIAIGKFIDNGKITQDEYKKILSYAKTNDFLKK